MTWREKLNKMAMIDILYMCCDNTNKRYGGTCFHDIMTGTVCTECDFDCHKCMEKLLDEEVSQKRQGA